MIRTPQERPLRQRIALKAEADTEVEPVDPKRFVLRVHVQPLEGRLRDEICAEIDRPRTPSSKSGAR